MKSSDTIITSTQNTRVKKLILLQQKSAERRKAGLFVLEGRRELLHCLHSGYEIDTVFYCPQLLFVAGESGELRRVIAANPSLEVSAEVYERIAYRGSTEGVVAQMKVKTMALADLQLPDNPLLMVLERVEKPGNLGAVLRSADAAAADAVIVCDPLTDLYNPNLIRSSIGAIFTVPTVACSSVDCIAFLKERGIRILTAQLQDSHLYYDTDMPPRPPRPTRSGWPTSMTGWHRSITSSRSIMWKRSRNCWTSRTPCGGNSS